MPKTRKKPALPVPAAPANRPGGAPSAVKAKVSPRPQVNIRWQRTKRYGWDSR